LQRARYIKACESHDRGVLKVTNDHNSRADEPGQSVKTSTDP